MPRLALVSAVLLGVTLTSTLAGTPPARAAVPPTTYLFADSVDDLLEENGDGVWESATVDVLSDLEAGHWSVRTAAGVVAAEADLTSEQVVAARGPGFLSLAIDSASLGVRLPAGTVTVTITATARGKQPASASVPIYVSAGAAPRPPTVTTGTVFPDDSHDGVAHAMSATVEVGSVPRARGAILWRVVDTSGKAVYGPYLLGRRERVLTWDGEWQTSDPGPAQAPAGRYRVQLLFTDGRTSVEGAPSAIFRLSRGYRTLRDVTALRPATATRTRTMDVRRAQLRVRAGSLHYRALDRRAQALVRTEHVVRIPASRAPGYPIFLRLEGRHRQPDGFDLEVVLPDGRVRDVDIFAKLSNRQVWYVVPPRLIRRDGTVRFRVRWDGFRYDGPARLDRIGVQTGQYVWHRR